MNVHHIIFDCSECRKNHILLIQEYETEVDPWSNMVGQLLGSRNTSQLLLEFIATMRVGEKVRVLDKKI